MSPETTDPNPNVSYLFWKIKFYSHKKDVWDFLKEAKLRNLKKEA